MSPVLELLADRCICISRIMYKQNKVPHYQHLYQKNDGVRQWWKVWLDRTLKSQQLKPIALEHLLQLKTHTWMKWL